VDKWRKRKEMKCTCHIHFMFDNMTSKHPTCLSRRHPLKRVRPDNENQPNGRRNKKFHRQSSHDFSLKTSSI
jgi:hypothetical protein